MGTFLDGTRTKQRIQCHAQGHNELPPVSLEPATLDPKSSTLLLSQHCLDRFVKGFFLYRVPGLYTEGNYSSDEIRFLLTNVQTFTSTITGITTVTGRHFTSCKV